MPITVVCSSCGSKLKAPDKFAGRKTKCPKCGKNIIVPASASVTPTAGLKDAPVARDWREAPPPAAASKPPAPISVAAVRSAAFSNLQEEEEEDRPARRRPQSDASTGGVAAHSLGIASMVVGVVALLFSFIPCIGVFSMPLSGLGLLLGIIGGVVALSRSGRGIGFPIAGSAINGMALLIALFWLKLASATHDALDNSIKETNATVQRIEAGNKNSGAQSAATVQRIEAGNKNSGAQSAQANEPREIVASLSVDELVKEWHENTALFKRRYDGKWVEVYGEVERVTEGFNRSKGGFIGEKEAELEFKWSGVGRLRCFFENADELLALKSKDKVAVIGRVYCGEITSLRLVDSRLNNQAGNRWR